MRTIAKLYDLGYELLPPQLFSPDLDPRDFFLFVDLKRTLVRKNFSTGKEVFAETEAYFESNEKLYLL